MKKILALLAAASIAFAPVANADIDNMDIGGDVLFMYFFSDDLDLNDNAADQTDFFRTEAHLYFQADLDDNITTRISVEADRALNQSSVGANNALVGGNADDLEIFLEELFVQWQNALGSNFNVSVGRQFLNYGDNSHADDFNGWWGDGFLFSDARAASPLRLDALGTFEKDPFDAMVIQYEADNSSIDVVYYIDTEELVSGALGNDGDAEGMLLYGSYYGIEGHQIDLYYNFNQQNNLLGFAGGPLGFDGDQHAFGVRAAGDIMPTLSYKIEAAYQFQEIDLAAVPQTEGFAVQGGLNYHPDMAYNPNIGIMYTLFQEDNGAGFNSPFEGKTYGLLAEGFVRSTFGGGAFTNMNVFNVYGGMEFTDNVAATLDLYYFLLDEGTLATGNEDDGGFEVDAQVDYLINNNMTAFLGGGILLPSDAFENAAGGNDDEAYFVRTGFKVNF